ncbi:MAG: hypothetical protein GF411_20000 [Candidatus Lokiarchaeota archaeon]|nr:hypothetical protein [Candidatus Lokiarchaeota archaeon]
MSSIAGTEYVGLSLRDAIRTARRFGHTLLWHNGKKVFLNRAENKWQTEDGVILPF